MQSVVVALLVATGATALEAQLMPQFYGEAVKTNLMPEFFGEAVKTQVMPNRYGEALKVELMPEFYTAPVSNGGVQFSRTVNSVNNVTAKATFASGCTSTDAYGSNDCNWPWGDANSVTYVADLEEDITSGTLSVDLKVNGIIPFKFDCPVCGANCTITIPIVGTKETFALPPCPISSKNIPAATTAFTLPAKNPLGVGASIAGSITITDQNKVVVASITLSAKLSD
jgi:hypothetical protein